MNKRAFIHFGTAIECERTSGGMKKIRRKAIKKCGQNNGNVARRINCDNSIKSGEKIEKKCWEVGWMDLG